MPPTPEQEYYDSLKNLTDEDLIVQGANELVSMHNADIRLHMIKNILAMRNVEFSRRLVFQYGKFAEYTRK